MLKVKKWDCGVCDVNSFKHLKPRKVHVQGARLRENQITSGFLIPGDWLALTIVSFHSHHSETCTHYLHVAVTKALGSSRAS